MRIAFSDLDGTLLVSDKSISPQTFAALDAMAERGLEFVPCSGRPVVGLPPELLAHPSVHYASCGNGSRICRIGEDGAPGEVLAHATMSKASALRLYELTHELDIQFDLFADGKVFSERARYERLGEFGIDPHFLPQVKAMRTPLDETVPEMLGHVTYLERLTLYWKHEQDCAYIRSLVAEDASLVCVNSLPTNLEISDVATTKGASLAWLCEFLGIPREESVAFGDSSNDSSMLEAAGDGVAMANATPEAIACANHRTASNDEHGVARYLMALMGELGE